MDTRAVYTLDQVVDMAKNRIRYFDDDRDVWLKQLLIEQLGQLNIFVTNHFSIAKLTVNPDTGIAILPEDYIGYINDPSINAEGKLWTLSLKPDIVLPADGSTCGEIDNDNPVYTPNIPYPYHFGAGGGASTNTSGFKIKGRIVIFDGYIPNNEVILEYMSSGISSDSITYVPFQVKETLVKYLVWQMAEVGDNVPQSEKIRREQQYDRECEKLSDFENSFTPDQVMDVIYSSFIQTANR